MSCFFSCFRVKDSSANLVTPSEPVAPRSKNALSSLFECDEDVRKGEESQNRLPGENDARVFKAEDKFSKSYGTSLETPVKIRKALEKWEDASAQNGGQKSLKFYSRLDKASMEKLKLEKNADESSILAGSASLLDSPSSCMTDGHYTGGVSSCSIQRSDVHYAVEAHSEQSKTESAISSISSEQSGSTGAQTVMKPLPYPNMEELDNKEPGDGDSPSSHQRGLNEPKDKGDLKLTPESDLSVREEMDDEGSLTSWFKPISAKQDGSNKQLSSISSQNKKPLGDRPILGMVAAHWNDECQPSDPPKWWDGNGIPNSTNKYKEDQKVSWHATPFEERLEKALSEESLISQRKPSGSTTPYEFNETEESDTAISHFQSSPHLKSVVSFRSMSPSTVMA